MQIVAIINQKGGSAKTTTAVNLGAGLVRKGKRVLLIDLDPQSHATKSLGIDARALEVSVYHVLKGEKALSEVIIDLFPIFLRFALPCLTPHF